MAVNISDGVKSELIKQFPAIFDGGAIFVYGTTNQPDTANHAVPPSTVVLARITEDGEPWTPGATNGLRFINAGSYAIPDPMQEWRIRGVANGTALWARLVGPRYDPGAATLSLPRVDCAVYTLAAPRVGLNLPSLTITTAVNRVVDGFQFTL